MTVGQSIRSGVKWLAFGKIGNRLFEFAFGVALARLLVPADFGMIATVQIFTGFVGMFVAGGMGQSLIRAKEADENDFTAVFTAQLGVGVLVYLGFFLAAPYIARLFSDGLYTDLVRVSALSFLLRPFTGVRNAWLNRQMAFKSRTLVSVASGLAASASSVAFALLGMGVWSLMISGLLGALLGNLWLGRLTPLRLRLNPDRATIRKHAGYGAKIVGADFFNYVRAQTQTLIVSKLAGPSFLGLLNKAESMSRLPNQAIMSPTMEPLFRAMSQTQDDLDQVKYLYHRSITLLTAYTAPVYVLLWWIAEPFITVVYGAKWSAAGEPMGILTLTGYFLNVLFPSSVVLAVRNQLGREIVATAFNTVLLAAGCWIGLRSGLVGVAWGIVLAQAVLTAQLYGLVLRTIPARPAELWHAVAPGLLLAGLSFAFLALLDRLLGGWQATHPTAYLLAMAILGGCFAAGTFLFLPLRALQSESSRWRELATKRLRASIGGGA